MDGMIVGGWEYVWGAWGISLSLLLSYIGIVTMRLAHARGAAEDR